jgi:hypothetical protein
MATTLHIRCGSDIRDGLSEAGIPGDFLEFADPVCQGPVPEGDGAAFEDARLSYIVGELGYSAQEAKAKLDAALKGLANLGDYDRLVMWFEHDIYDQAVLIRLLAWFAERPELHDKLQLIAVGSFPGIERFVGLGQLAPDQLAALWGSEEPVTQAQIALGVRAWAAFRAPDPSALHDLIQTGTPDLPLLAPALLRHLQELPWTLDGLALTERLTLRAVAEGAETPGQCFRELYERLEPQPFLGDIMYWPIVARLARAPQPALTDFKTFRDPIEFTPFGQDLLAGEADWIAANGIDRWVGGVHLTPERAWRWDPAHGRPKPPAEIR